MEDMTMADRLEQIRDRVTKGYANPHRWEYSWPVSAEAQAESDVGWLLDEVRRLRDLIVDARDETWDPAEKLVEESDKILHSRQHRAGDCPWFDCPDYRGQAS